MTTLSSTARAAVPRYAWLAVILEVATAVMAIPVGLMFLTDPSGGSVQIPADWLAGSPFESYFVPGLYLFAMNGIGMLVAAGLTVTRHGLAPWATGALGAGMIIWITVQLVVMPETMVLQWVFMAVGLALVAIALAWLRRTGQVRLG